MIFEELNRKWSEVPLLAFIIVFSITVGCIGENKSDLPPIGKAEVTDIKFDDEDLLKWDDDKIKLDEYTYLIFSVKNVDKYIIGNLKVQVFFSAANKLNSELVSPSSSIISQVAPTEKRQFKFRISSSGENPGKYVIIIRVIDEFGRTSTESFDTLEITA